MENYIDGAIPCHYSSMLPNQKHSKFLKRYMKGFAEDTLGGIASLKRSLDRDTIA